MGQTSYRRYIHAQGTGFGHVVVAQQLERRHAAGGALANRHLNGFVDVILTRHRWVIALTRY